MRTSLSVFGIIAAAVVTAISWGMICRGSGSTASIMISAGGAIGVFLSSVIGPRRSEILHYRLMRIPLPPAPLDGYQPWNRATKRQLRRAVRLYLLTTRGWVFLVLAIALGVLSYRLLSAWNQALDHPWAAVLGMLVCSAVWGALLLGSVPWGTTLLLRLQERKSWIRGYFDDHATLLVYPKEGRWAVGDHFAVPRNKGLGRQLREKVFRHLADEADKLGVEIEMETRSPALAQERRSRTLFVRGLLSATAIRPTPEGDDDEQLNPFAATPRDVKPDAWHMGATPTRVKSSGVV